MKIKSIVFMAAMLLSFMAEAQVLDSSSDKVSESIDKETVNTIVKSDISAVEEEKKTLPVEMTPEQKAEIDISAMKDIKGSIKKQSIRDRKDFIDALVHSERMLKRRAALVDGKTEKEATAAEDEVKKTNLNVSSDSDIEKFLYEKANLINE